MGKPKKISATQSQALLEKIPAYECICATGIGGKRYVWQSWGLVIRHFRDFAGVDQAVFGRLLKGYTRGQIGRYETEQTEPPIDFWLKMMRTFGLNITWVLTGKGQPYITEFVGSEDRARFYEWKRLLREQADFLWQLQGE